MATSASGACDCFDHCVRHEASPEQLFAHREVGGERPCVSLACHEDCLSC